MERSFFSALSVLFLMCIVLFTHGTAAAEDTFKVTSIDVGKGDCILVQTGAEDNPSNVLIDTGYKDTAKDVLKYLEKNGIQKLDAIIISHFHKDHVGGAARILEKIPVGIVYMPDYEGTRKVYKEMMDVLSQKGILCERLKENRSISFGNAKYDLYPSTIKFDGDNDNDVSMAATLEYNGDTALFAGDLEEEGVKQFLSNNRIPEKHYDILKLPHHGSEGNNTKDLLARLKDGGIVVITDGQDRRAHGTLLDTLAKDGFQTYCAADDGTITVTAAGDGYTVEKSKNPNHLIEGDWKYLLADDGSAVLTGYTGNKTNITLPSKLGGKQVKTIADSAFYNHKDLKRVIIPNGVSSIGDSAFSWCTGLESVTIPGSVTTIGKAAFSWCTSLGSVTIPDSVTSVGDSGFERCTALKNVKLSTRLTEIAPSLFERCESLESIDVPAGVQTIGEDAFKRCMGLRNVRIPGSVTKIDEGAFKRCESLGSIRIPESVTNIKDEAFQNCKSLKEIRYGGTAEQWDKVKKGKNWAIGTSQDLQIYYSDTEDDPEPEPAPEPHRGSRFFTLPELPGTGFSAGQSKSLSEFPKDLRYEPSGLTLQIPSLDMTETIVMIPFRNGEYPVEWLGKNIGLPEEFDLPGSGPSVLVGHNHLNTTEAGPFGLLRTLADKALIFVSDREGILMKFSVTANEKIAANDMAATKSLSAACENSLILITCEDERPEGGYASRRIVVAKPVISE